MSRPNSVKLIKQLQGIYWVHCGPGTVPIPANHLHTKSKAPTRQNTDAATIPRLPGEPGGPIPAISSISVSPGGHVSSTSPASPGDLGDPLEIFHLPPLLISSLPLHFDGSISSPSRLPVSLTHPVPRAPPSPSPPTSPLLPLGGTSLTRKLSISNGIKSFLYHLDKPLFFRKEDYKPEIWTEMIRLIIKNPERVALVGKGIGSATAEQVGDAMESIARIQWAQMGRGFIGDGLRIGHLDVGVQRLVRLKMGFPKLKKENVENYEKMLRVPISWDWEIVKGINNRKKRFTDRVIRDQPWWGDCHWWTED